MGPADPSLSGLSPDERSAILGVLVGRPRRAFEPLLDRFAPVFGGVCPILASKSCVFIEKRALETLIEAVAIFTVPFVVMAVFAGALKVPWARPEKDLDGLIDLL